MCIYLGEAKGLHYDSADHIIPAGLGGKIKLPLDYVSREFNNLSSKYEMALMRSSILGLPRQILGPGKRGSLNPNKATRSSINVFRQPDNGEFSLGYIKMGKPFEIPHIILNSQTGEFKVSISKEASDFELQVFKQRLTMFETLRVKIIAFPDLEPNIFLLGINPDNPGECYIACLDGKTHPFNSKALTAISNTFENRDTFSGSSSYKIETHQNAVFDDNYYKCCAKIALNCLAYLNDKRFVLQEHFTPLKNWIVNGGDNKFVKLSPNHNTSMHTLFPEDSHQVIITKTEIGLIADVCFYNHFHNLVLLSTTFSDPFPINGFICDWKEKKEFDYYNYLIEYKNGTNWNSSDS